MAVLSGHNLTCIKKDRVLFSALNFTLQPSRVLYIKGPNGAGKTSLLRILVGLSEPHEGDIRFLGQDIQDDPETFYQSLVYFGHKLGVNGHLSAVDNTRYWCELHKAAFNRQDVMQLLAELGLVGLEDLRVSQLSAGQQRRVALARLWLKRDAKLWVLDEPFTALDVQGIALLKTHMKQHLEAGGSVVLTSHQSLDLGYPIEELELEYLI